jgi:hypothetical protein
MNRSDYRRSLIYIFLLALSVRLVFIFTMQDGFYFGDSVKYSAAAVNLLANGEFGDKYTRPPVYPVFLAGIYASLEHNEVASLFLTGRSGCDERDS